jgi:hypothetical protein
MAGGRGTAGGGEEIGIRVLTMGTKSMAIHRCRNESLNLIWDNQQDDKARKCGGASMLSGHG